MRLMRCAVWGLAGFIFGAVAMLAMVLLRVFP